jgi:hypothetical protein
METTVRSISIRSYDKGMMHEFVNASGENMHHYNRFFINIEFLIPSKTLKNPLLRTALDSSDSKLRSRHHKYRYDISESTKKYQ